MSFKENLIFELEKNNLFENMKKFKSKITKLYGKIDNLNELCLKVQNYQIDNYGGILLSFENFPTKEVKRRANMYACQRKYKRIRGVR